VNADAFQILRQLVRDEIGRLRLPELAVVQDIHPHSEAGDDDNYAVTVRLRDSGAVLPRVPLATSRKGMASVPDVGDLVLVQFLGGDADAPIVTASLYNDEDRPPVNADGEAVLALPATGGGVELRAVSAGTPAVTLTVGGALTVTLQDDDPVVAIEAAGARVRIDSDGTVTISTGSDLNIEGQGNVAIKGTQVTMEASGELTLKGARINLN
jgi:phage baseplate assembly protein V